MYKKILPVVAVLVLSGCATMPMQGETCCPKTQHQCDCPKCNDPNCCCNNEGKTSEGKICMKKPVK